MTLSHDLIARQASAALRALDGHKAVLDALDAHRSLATGTLTGAFSVIHDFQRTSSIATLARATSSAMQPTIDHAQQLFGSPAFASAMRSVEGLRMHQVPGLETFGESIRQINEQFRASTFPATQLLAQLQSARSASAQLGSLAEAGADAPWMRQVI